MADSADCSNATANIKPSDSAAQIDAEVMPARRLLSVRRMTSNASNFAWRKNGAIEQFFNQHVQTEFFDHHFRYDRSIRIVKNGMLPKKSHRQLLDKLRAIGELFDDTTWEERKLPARDKLGTSMVLAVRHSYFRAFRELERQFDDKDSGVGR